MFLLAFLRIFDMFEAVLSQVQILFGRAYARIPRDHRVHVHWPKL